MRFFADIFNSARAAVTSVVGGRNVWGLADQLLILKDGKVIFDGKDITKLSDKEESAG